MMIGFWESVAYPFYCITHASFRHDSEPDGRLAVVDLTIFDFMI